MNNGPLKPGYKQTEVGVIPEDWEVRTIGELGNVVRGGSPRPAGDLRYFNGTCIPWLTVAALTNIPDNQLRVSETVGHLTAEGAKHSRTLVNNTLIIANSGATLGVAKLLDITCCANDGIAAIINQSFGDKEFICHYVNTRTKYLRDVVATGNGQPNLNTTLLKKIHIPFPSTEEQRAIAAVLSDVDALLAKLDQFIAKKRDLKLATMQQLLTGKTRLPGFSGEWEVKMLGDVVQIFSGGTPKTSNPSYWNGSIKWCTPTDITSCAGKYLMETHRSITHEGLASCSARLLPVGSLLLCSRATIGELKIAGEVICTNQGFKSLICNSDVSNEFLYYKLVTMKSQMIERAIGSTFLEISKKDTAILEITIPSYDEQTAIATILSDMDAEIAALETRRDKTRDIKQGMMQELLTGRIRLV